MNFIRKDTVDLLHKANMLSLFNEDQILIIVDFVAERILAGCMDSCVRNDAKEYLEMRRIEYRDRKTKELLLSLANPETNGLIINHAEVNKILELWS